MDIAINKMDEIRSLAQKLSYYNNLLIKQSDSWLPEEEGVRNMEKQIAERRKKEKSIRN